VKLLPLIALTILYTVTTHALGAETIPFADKQLSLLGIKLANPILAKGSPGAPLSARVTIPSGQEIVVSAPDAASVRSIEVATGDEVKLDQPLAVLASPALLGLQRDFLQAVTEENLSRQQLVRDKQMANEGIIPKRRLEETRTRHHNQQLLVKEHTSVLKIAGFTGEDINELRDKVTLREVVTLRSPLAGVVLEKLAHTGERLEAGAPMFRVADLSHLWLEIRVPINQSVTKGQTVNVEGRAVNGQILLVGQSVDPSTQTYLARAEIKSGQELVRTGEALNVRLLTQSETAGTTLLSLPREAVVRSGKSSYVFVRSANQFEAREIQIQGYAGNLILISEGLETSESVAISGVAAIKAAWQGIGGGE
jgi:cobalt-zinc-cadmium efflux system membrane fusion protein